MADPSPWPSVIAAAVTGLLTGGGLLIQTHMTTKRDERRLKAEAEEKDKDRRREAEDREAENLFKARAEWIAAFHSYYMKIRFGLLLTKGNDLSEEQARAHAELQRSAGELVLHTASRLQLIEKNPVNRRLIKTLTLFIGMDREPNDPKAGERLEDLSTAFMKFEDVLAGIDGDPSDVIKRLVPLARGLGVSLERMTEHIRASKDVSDKAAV